MLDVLNLPKPQNGYIDYFSGAAATAATSWRTWEKPRGISMIDITCIGAGGGGRSGWSATTGTAAVSGGGGGGSGGFTRLLIPAVFLPDVLYIQVGRGGAGGLLTTTNSASAGVNGTGSYVSIAPSFDPIYLACFANGGSGAAVGSVTNGPGGIGALVATQTSAPMSGLGIFSALAGQTGGIGYGGGDLAYPTTSLLLSGGAGGGSATSSPSGGTGFNVTAPTQTSFSLIPTITGGAFNSGLPGSPGMSISQPLMSIGGAGGSGAISGTSFFNAEGGNGGAGGLGSGGGGGGGGTISAALQVTLLLELPIDGTQTATYGGVQYASSAYTNTTTTYASTSYTSASIPRSNASPAWTVSTPSVWTSGNIGYVETIPTTNTITTLSSNPYVAYTNANNRTGWANHVYTDSSGNIYVTTETGLLLKFNSSWVLQWQRKIEYRSATDVTYRAAGVKVKVDSSGNIYWLLNTYNPQGTSPALNLLIKYNSSGTLLSIRSYGGGNSTFAFDMEIDSSGNIYMPVVDGAEYLRVVKLDSSFNIVWQYRYGNYQNIIPSLDYPTSYYLHDDSGNSGWTGTPYKGQGGLRIDSSGNIYIATTGRIGDPGGGNSNALLIKLNNNGDLQWMTGIGGTANNELFRDLVLDSSGNIYATGHEFSGTRYGAFTVKFDSSGNVLWQTSLNIGANILYPIAFSIDRDSSDNVYICGHSRDSDFTGFVAKYNSSGTVLWQRTIKGGNNSNTDLNSIFVNSSSGKYYVIGKSNLTPTSRTNGNGGKGGDGLVIIQCF
jgi:hypothetical protein